VSNSTDTLEKLARVAVDGSNLTPVGTVGYFPGTSAPAGWLKANGGLYSRSVYANLFAAIGTTYGVGDGSTTFNVPDLRGEFVRGFDDGRGVDSGRGIGTGQTDAFQGHGVGSAADQRAVVIGAYATASVTGTGGIYSESLGAGTLMVPQSDGTNGTPRTAAETRPRNVALLACIKF
jgi:phage-related tail fiber protein